MLALSYIAVLLASISYWFQVYHIHVHKEVRDLSIPAFVIRLLASLMLCWTAIELEDSVIFFIKNLLIVIPTAIILLQIYVHRDDKYIK